MEINMTKEVHIRLRNIKKEDYDSLKKIALKKTGSASPTSLARHLVMQTLLEKNKEPIDLNSDGRTNRLEIRLPEDAINALSNEASLQTMTLNQYIRLLLITHLSKDSVLTANEVKALRESNYQIYKLGVNINQVAKALNMGNATSLSLKELQNLNDAIDKHVAKVGQLLQATRKRL